MKSIRIPLFLLLMAAALLLVSGCSKHYVDVYINEAGLPVTLDNEPETAIDPLWVFPGDYVIFNNMRADEEVILRFPSGMFELDTVTIEAGHRKILKVIADGPMTGTLTITGDGIPAGNPEVIVGEDP